MKKKSLIALIMAVCIIFGNVGMASAAETDSYTCVETEYGYLITERLVDNGIYVATTERHIYDSDIPYTITTVMHNNEMAVFNSKTGILCWDGNEIYVEITETPMTRAARPTSIDHSYTFKSKWGYIKSDWITVKLETTLQNITELAVMTALKAVGVAISLAKIIVNGITDSPHKNDNSFWVRKYVYGNHHVLSDMRVLATQLYYEDYTPVPEGCSCVTSELAS